MDLAELLEAIDTFKAPDMRDRFAMAALTGLLANTSRDSDFVGYAKDAYEFADAMVAEMGDGRAAAAQREGGES